MCEESSSSDGRIRLPPPPLKYSAISVMVLTLDAASRPNSCSIATRSSRSRAKTALAVAIASVLKALRFPCLILHCVRCHLLVEPFQSPSHCGSIQGPPNRRCSVRAVVRKLQLQSKILAPQQGNNLLQFVAVLAGYPDSIALSAGLRLLFRVLHQANNLLGLFGGDALLQLDLLPHALPRRFFQLLVGQILQRDSPLHQLLSQNLLHRLQLVLPGRG